ncbi:MAG: tRNA (N(6)-L-threonylcarbamoyladenosine(37)-C(2))-methylthiotransferase MtaB [bacterium]
MKIAVDTLGCRVNQSESESLLNRFAKLGFDLVSADEQPDVYVLNSCSITTAAEASARKLVRRQKKNNPDVKIIFTGCYAKLAASEIEENLPEIDFLFPGERKEEIPAFLNETRGFTGGKGEAGINFRTRKFLKVQDGCRDFCTYCIVPHIRNRLVSEPLEKVSRDVTRLVEEEQYPEIVFTGIHLGQYGVDLDHHETDLVALVRKIENIKFTREVRFRLSSLEPQDAGAELIETVAGASKFCNHLHLPLQSGSDLVLERMGRRYDVREYLDTIKICRRCDPDFAISTDLIVGFPGESEADFEQTLEAVGKAKFSDLHVFKYSKRPGTPAADFEPEIPGDVVTRRSKKLRKAGRKQRKAYCQRFLGKPARILIENNSSENYSRGYSSYYLPVRLAGKHKPGTFVEAEIDTWCRGELLVFNREESERCVI